METPDRCWKWGIFYVNRDDPALLARKRYGIGYTLNFGNRWSWAILALIVVAIVLPLTAPILCTPRVASTISARIRALPRSSFTAVSLFAIVTFINVRSACLSQIDTTRCIWV